MKISSIGLLPLGLFVGICAGISGVLLQGIETAILWAIVGYFLGKSVQSVLWALRPQTPA
jgi:hypothetical protein